MITPPTTLNGWLSYLEGLHPSAISMGLDRIERVRKALDLKTTCPVITVGGTNGKGSCCAMLEAMLTAAGYAVGCYTSPHLLRYNERLRIAGAEVPDETWCDAFAKVERARGETLLTYFEFGTLAAMLVCADANLDVVILEVGLGGRLDAVNVFDADCALVASVSLDHTDFLGPTRESIGFEKAGIFRAGRPAICADRNPPQSLLSYAEQIGARLQTIDRDFGFEARSAQWRYWGSGGSRPGLPFPVLRGACQMANASACIAVLDMMRDSLPVTMSNIRDGLLKAEIAGRFQVLPGRPVVVLDVAHNPGAAEALAANLAAMTCKGRTLAVFAMLKDKDIASVAAAVAPHISQWFVAPLQGPRGAANHEIAAAMSLAGITGAVVLHDDVEQAWQAACICAGGDDRIVAFGSFLTVAAVMRDRQGERSRDAAGH